MMFPKKIETQSLIGYVRSNIALIKQLRFQGLKMLGIYNQMVDASGLECTFRSFLNAWNKVKNEVGSDRGISENRPNQVMTPAAPQSLMPGVRPSFKWQPKSGPDRLEAMFKKGNS